MKDKMNVREDIEKMKLAITENTTEMIKSLNESIKSIVGKIEQVRNEAVTETDIEENKLSGPLQAISGAIWFIGKGKDKEKNMEIIRNSIKKMEKDF
jgi:L-lactate utilization protein LutB